MKDEKVAKLLQELQMQMYLPRFEEHEIDVDVLLDVTDEDLLKLGVDKLGHRRKLLTHIDKCKSQCKPTQPFGSFSLQVCTLS